MTKQKISEKDIAAAVRKYLEADGWKFRQDVPITLPDHGAVSLDLLGCKSDPSHDFYTAIECKMRLNQELESQAVRWLPYAHLVAVAYDNHGGQSRNRKRIDRVDERGIGRFVVSDVAGVLLQHSPHFRATSLLTNCSLLSAAFHAHDGSLDAASGSAAAKRMTDARCQWEPLRRFLHLQNGQALEWAMLTGAIAVTPSFPFRAIVSHVPEMRRFTAAAVRKAIDKGECVGVGYRGTSITEFFATK